MAFSMQLFCVLFILMCVLLFFSVQGRMSAVFSVLFAVLLLVPTDAMGIISGTSYNTPGKFNISLEGYAVIFAFLIVVVIKRGTLRVKSRKIVLTILFALMLMLSIRILADGGGAASNKMLDGYLLPAIFAVLLLGYLDAHSLPKVLKTIYVCILISAVVACIEFVIGKSLFFHGYYMANIKWYKSVYDSTAWGVMFRTTALLGHPLVGGTYYVLALVYFLNTRTRGRWITSAAQAIVLALAIFSTNSRAVIFCAIGYTLYYLLKQKKYFKLSMVAFAGLIALSFIDFSSLYTMIFSRDKSGSSVSVRVRALGSILSIPGSVVLKGTGYNNTSGLLNSLGFSGNFELSFLIVFVENGLIGFVAWLVSLITLYDKRMLKEIDGMKVKSMVNGMIVCFLAVSATSNSFGDPGTLNYILWALLAFTRVASTETNKLDARKEERLYYGKHMAYQERRTEV